MKTKTVILSLALLATNISIAGDYACKEIYKTKITKMRKNHNLRVAAKISATVVVTAGLILSGGFLVAAGSVAAVGTGGGAIVGGLTLISLGSAGPLPYFAIDAFDREYGIIQAMHAQELMNISHDDLLKAAREALLKQFDDEIKDPAKLKEYVRNLNISRVTQDLPVLSQDESINLIKEEISRSAKVSNQISESLTFAKSKGLVASTYTYEDWRQVMKTNEDLFCINGKARTLRQATKAIGPLAR